MLWLTVIIAILTHKMKHFFCPLLLHLTFLASVQNPTDKGYHNSLEMNIKPDSVLVENIVSFSKMQSQEAKSRIDFTLSVTNLGLAAIPDLGLANRMDQVHFLINGDEIPLMGLGNGKEIIGGDRTIKQNSIQTFTQSWALDKNNELQKYNGLFTTQWTYNGIKSTMLKVNLYDQTAVIVHPKPEILVDSVILKRPLNYTNATTVGKLLEWLNTYNKFEMDAYYNVLAYPNYVVSGEKNAIVDERTRTLSNMGIDLIWDSERLKFYIQLRK